MYALGCLALAATVASCGSNANKKAAADSTATAQAQAPAEDEGWTVIFDGKTLDGWRGYDKTGVPAAWTVEDGAIKINGSGMGEAGAQDGGDLIYANKKFKNFELEFEYKVDKGANSGVFYLAQEIPGQPIFISAPEYQVLDNANHPDAKLGVDGNRKSASLYDMIPAVPQNAKPFGEWNKAKIMVYKGTVVHGQNGQTSWSTTSGRPSGRRCSKTASSRRRSGRSHSSCSTIAAARTTRVTSDSRITATTSGSATSGSRNSNGPDHMNEKGDASSVSFFDFSRFPIIYFSVYAFRFPTFPAPPKKSFPTEGISWQKPNRIRTRGRKPRLI